MVMKMLDENGEEIKSKWEEDCQRYWGRVLTGRKRHYCPDWDYLPIDETTPTEMACCTGNFDYLDDKS